MLYMTVKTSNYDHCYSYFASFHTSFLLLTNLQQKKQQHSQPPCTQLTLLNRNIRYNMNPNKHIYEIEFNMYNPVCK